jgi:hypothetical protein
MGQGETGIGESPAGAPRVMGPGGLNLKRKLVPNKSRLKLTVKKNWKKSFSKFTGKIGGGKI